MESFESQFNIDQRLAPEVEKPKELDARDYFEITAFQKMASDIDANPEHRWDLVSTYLLIEDKESLIAGGETYNKEKEQVEFLLALQTSDGAKSSVLIDMLENGGGRDVFEYMRSFLPCLPKKVREQVVGSIIQEAAEWNEDTLVHKRLTDRILQALPDIVPMPDIAGHDFFNHVEDPSQRKELQDYLETIGRKTNPENFAQRLDDLTDSLRFRDNVFTSGYKHLFKEMLEWVDGSRDDFKKDYEVLKTAEPEKFTLEDKVTQRIDTQEELQAVLGSMEVKGAPDTGGLQYGERRAEMVPLEKVMGAVLIEDGWNVSRSDGRGIETIFKFVRGFQDGTIDLLGHNSPIKVIEIDGEYFIEGDGRHRTAALKALGVREVPMLVTHVKR